MDCVYWVWQTDIMESVAVYERELPNFFCVVIRNVHMGKQFAVVTGMGSHLIEVSWQLSFNPVEQKHPFESSRRGTDRPSVWPPVHPARLA